MFFSWLDKFIFAALLLLTLQIPTLIDQYRQYLSGYIDALTSQVEDWQALANDFNFETVDELIQHYKNTDDEIIKAEAQLKQNVLLDLSAQQQSFELLNSANYPRQVIHIFSPAQSPVLKRVFKNFKPGLSLSLNTGIYSVVLAIVLNILLLAPFWIFKRILARRSDALLK